MPGSTLRILHVSDLHARESRRVDLQLVVRALLDRLRRIVSEAYRPIDVICLTGDVAYSGKSTEYALAEELFLRPLLEATSVPRDRLFVVPGNHDVDRAVIASDASHEEELAQSLTSRDAVNALLDNHAARQRAFLRLSDYAAFARSLFHGRANGQEPGCYVSIEVELESGPLRVACLNSAWRCSGANDFGRLLVGERQIDSSLEATHSRAVRVALLHHPLNWLAEFDQASSSNRFYCEADIVLTGHVHIPTPIVTIAPGGSCLFSSAGAIFDGRGLNGFSIVEYDAQDRSGFVELWRYFDDRRTFDADLLTAPQGRFDFSLAKQDCRDVGATGTKPGFSADLLSSQLDRTNFIQRVFEQVRSDDYAVWILGLALRVTARAPVIGSSSPNIYRQALSHDGIAQFLEEVLALQRSVEDSTEVTMVLASIAQLNLLARKCWPPTVHGVAVRGIALVIGEVLSMAEEPSAEAAPTLLNGAERLLADKDYEGAISLLRELDPNSPDVRRLLADAYALRKDHTAVIELLAPCKPGELSQPELENLIWSTQATLGDVSSLLAIHDRRFSNASARIFRANIATRSARSEV